jgi:hypothetical protein
VAEGQPGVGVPFTLHKIGGRRSQLPGRSAGRQARHPAGEDPPQSIPWPESRTLPQR